MQQPPNAGLSAKQLQLNAVLEVEIGNTGSVQPDSVLWDNSHVLSMKGQVWHACVTQIHAVNAEQSDSC